MTLHGCRIDAPLTFFGGLLVLVSTPVAGALALALGRRRSWPPALLRPVAGLLLISLVLLAVELLWRAVEAVGHEPEIRAVYSYEQARADPAGFRRWS